MSFVQSGLCFGQELCDRMLALSQPDMGQRVWLGKRLGRWLLRPCGVRGFHICKPKSHMKSIRNAPTDSVKQSRGAVFSPLGVLRLAQARVFARFLSIVGRTSVGRSLICRTRQNPRIGGVLRWLLGFRGTFASLEEAKMCAARYVSAGHEHPDEHALQVAKAEMTRESDYPMLFFLAPFAAELRSVFDLGGGIGNLFFVLNRHLCFSDELVWKIHDLPIKRQPAIAFATLKKESRVTFTEDFSSASGVDLFTVVGALQYFEPTLADLIHKLEKLPKHVIVNRSPCSHGQDIITIQDCWDWSIRNWNWVIPCKLHSVTKLVSGMQGLGYELVASWPVHERRLEVPLYPEYTEPYYGFYFRRNGGDD
jgi:putative methyltransferase (TIGR04325 family)